MGFDTTNSTDLEGIIQGLSLLLREGWLPVMVEGDLNILIQMAKHLANGKTTEKVSSSWRLANRLENLRSLVIAHPIVSFHHIRREANQVTDILANVRASVSWNISPSADNKVFRWSEWFRSRTNEGQRLKTLPGRRRYLECNASIVTLCTCN